MGGEAIGKKEGRKCGGGRRRLNRILGYVGRWEKVEGGREDRRRKRMEGKGGEEDGEGGMECGGRKGKEKEGGEGKRK